MDFLSKDDRILTVGDGDLSFSLSVAKLFPKKKYIPFVKHTIKELQKRDIVPLHGIDALQLSKPFQGQTFDKIVWNFPHSGFPEAAYGKWFENEEEWLNKHKDLVEGFFASAQQILNDEGNIIITHKHINAFKDWNLEELALNQQLQLKEKCDFDFGWFPGYENRRGSGKNPAKRFPAEDAVIYIFQKQS